MLLNFVRLKTSDFIVSLTSDLRPRCRVALASFGSARNLSVLYIILTCYKTEKTSSLASKIICSPWKEHIIGASQTQLHPIRRPGHTEFNLIYWQLMDIMWQELSVNTSWNLGNNTETGSLATTAIAFISILLFLLRCRKSIGLITPLSLSENVISTSNVGFKSTIALYKIIYFLRCAFYTAASILMYSKLTVLS